MKENHDEAIKLMEAFLDKLEFHTRGKAVDAACGCGALSVDFLAHKYKPIYMFDRDFEAVDMLE